MIDLSIIIVHYKTPTLLYNCVESIYQYKKEIIAEIIIIDNNSEDQSEQLLKKDFPEIIWLQSRYNAGFARANNTGIKVAKGEFVLLLNSDTLICENTLEKCLATIKSDREIGLLGCKLLNKDGSLQISAYPKLPNMSKVLEANPIYIYFTRKKTYKEKRITMQLELHGTIHEPTWVCGAFMLMPAKIFKEHKLYFDEDFFMYGEDVLLCHHIKRSGYKIIFTPEVSIYHLSGSSYYNDDYKSAQIIISEWLLMIKLYSKFYYILYILFLSFNFFMDSFILFINKSIKKQINAHDASSIIYRKFVLTLIKQYFFLELRKNNNDSTNRHYLQYK
jgi:GT2 family glycosyltransferase